MNPLRERLAQMSNDAWLSGGASVEVSASTLAALAAVADAAVRNQEPVWKEGGPHADMSILHAIAGERAKNMRDALDALAKALKVPT
jgi:uncharacterized membrane protein